MKTLPLCLTAALLLGLPAVVHANSTSARPVGASVCAAAGCVTTTVDDVYVLSEAIPINMSLPMDIANGVVRVRSTGALQWGSGGCSAVAAYDNQPGDCVVVPGYEDVWTVSRSNKYRTTPYAVASLRRFVVTASGASGPGHYADSLTLTPALDSADCNPTGPNESFFLTPRHDVGMLPNADAPQDFVDACGGVRQSAESTQEVAVAKPQSATACPTIAVGKRRATVTATGVACAAARTQIAKYVRTGSEPAGMVCVTARSGRNKAATCKSTARTKRAKRIVARWRV